MFKADTVILEETYSIKTGQRMAESLIRKLGQKPSACWLFCVYKTGLKDLVQGICDAIGTCNIIGCTSAGEISSKGLTTESIVLGGIATDQIDFQVVFAENISQDNEQAGKIIAGQFSPEVSYIQLFSDGITGNGCAILRGMTSVLGEQIPIAGGTSSNFPSFFETRQIAGKKILKDAAVAIGFIGTIQLGTGFATGWSPIGLAKEVTRASGNILYELNGESALKVYERFLGKHAENLPEVGVEYPLGFTNKLIDANYYLLRATMSVNREDGSIQFAGEVPQGSMVNLCCGDSTSIIKATNDALRMALNDLKQAIPVLIFVYSCVARITLLGINREQEIKQILNNIGNDIPLLGFYTYGEYCRIKPQGPNLFHNESITISILGL